MFFNVFNPLRKWKKGDYPISPAVYIQLTSFLRDQDERVLIGHQLMTEQEVDEQINQLAKELEIVRKKAKKELKATLAKQIK